MSEERESAELETLRRLLRLMRCPGCRVPYRFESVPQKAANGVYGSLRCRCREWPVIDAIPILSERRVGAHEHTMGIEEHRGASAAELAEMVRAGMGGKALVECLAIPVVLPQRLRRLPLLRRLWNHPAALAVGRALGRARVRRMLRRAPESVTAQDWLQLFFGRFSPLSGSLLSYFLHRFSMPRQLAAMSAMSLVSGNGRPLLDVACGFGHLAHFVKHRGIAPWVVGVDINFYPMWAASRTIVPHASFVVLDASQPLPFRDGEFGAAICSDAFSYIKEKELLFSEMRRCTDDGALLFTRVGNRTALPGDSEEELSARQYLELLGPDRTWIFSEGELVKRYLSRRPPDLSHRPEPEELQHEKWLSMIVSAESLSIPATERDGTWPHEAGTLQLNPMYRATRRPDGGLRLSLEYPSVWFALENAGAMAYLPFEADLSPDAMAALRSGQRTSEIEALIATFVLLGLPPGYTHDRIRTSEGMRGGGRATG